MRHTNNTTTVFWIAALLTFAACTTTIQAQAKDTTPLVIDGKAAPAVPKPQSKPDPYNPTAILRSAKTIYVKSSSLLVGEAVIETKLRKRSEFQQLGLVITRDPNEADLVLELKHDLFTMYVYTAIDPNTSIVVASGKLSSLGGTVAGKVAKRFLKEMVKARIT
jgi:hypothetical protein